MRGLVRFVRKRGWSQVAMLLVGVAAIIGTVVAALLGNSLGSFYILVLLCLAGAGSIILALVCMFIGPPDESPEAEDKDAEDAGAKDVAKVGLEVPPKVPVRLPEGVPRDTTVEITASEELENDSEGSGNDEPPDP